MVIFDRGALRCRGVDMGRRRHILYGAVMGHKMLDEVEAAPVRRGGA